MPILSILRKIFSTNRLHIHDTNNYWQILTSQFPSCLILLASFHWQHWIFNFHNSIILFRFQDQVVKNVRQGYTGRQVSTFCPNIWNVQNVEKKIYRQGVIFPKYSTCVKTNAGRHISTFCQYIRIIQYVCNKDDTLGRQLLTFCFEYSNVQKYRQDVRCSHFSKMCSFNI